jgi:hypothetical protein
MGMFSCQLYAFTHTAMDLLDFKAVNRLKANDNSFLRHKYAESIEEREAWAGYAESIEGREAWAARGRGWKDVGRASGTCPLDNRTRLGSGKIS